MANDQVVVGNQEKILANQVRIEGNRSRSRAEGDQRTGIDRRWGRWRRGQTPPRPSPARTRKASRRRTSWTPRRCWKSWPDFSCAARSGRIGAKGRVGWQGNRQPAEGGLGPGALSSRLRAVQEAPDAEAGGAVQGRHRASPAPGLCLGLGLAAATAKPVRTSPPGVRGGSQGRNSGAERGKRDWRGWLGLRGPGHRGRFRREKRCNRSFRWLTSAGGVAAEASGPRPSRQDRLSDVSNLLPVGKE